MNQKPFSLFWCGVVGVDGPGGFLWSTCNFRRSDWHVRMVEILGNYVLHFAHDDLVVLLSEAAQPGCIEQPLIQRHTRILILHLGFVELRLKHLILCCVHLVGFVGFVCYRFCSCRFTWCSSRRDVFKLLVCVVMFNGVGYVIKTICVCLCVFVCVCVCLCVCVCVRV